MTEQRNVCFQQFLAESKQSVTYRLHMTFYVKLIDNKPVMPWNSEPFMCSVLVSYDTAAVITEDKTAFLTYGTKKFTAL
ncbi:hypothetical protein DW967_02685 [Agathobacter rectalis]|uniref:Uncharacterized protein n=1 Tax=Agathobacter rectalis TaxID=39491 RepID=A0A413Q985_9FIRM|nr:hypothetical protein DW967_02685 [Agathobacter rectalis]